jgi:hypothetical protein
VNLNAGWSLTGSPAPGGESARERQAEAPQRRRQELAAGRVGHDGASLGEIGGSAQVAGRIAAGGARRHVPARVVLRRQCEGHRERELPLRRVAGERALAPELPLHHHVESADGSLLRRDEAEHVGPEPAVPGLRLEVDRAGQPTVLERELRLPEFVGPPERRLAARVVHEVESHQPRLEAVRKLAPHQRRGLVLPHPQVIQPERVLVDRSRSLRRLLVPAQHLGRHGHDEPIGRGLVVEPRILLPALRGGDLSLRVKLLEGGGDQALHRVPGHRVGEREQGAVGTDQVVALRLAAEAAAGLLEDLGEQLPVGVLPLAVVVLVHGCAHELGLEYVNDLGVAQDRHTVDDAVVSDAPERVAAADPQRHRLLLLRRPRTGVGDLGLPRDRPPRLVGRQLQRLVQILELGLVKRGRGRAGREAHEYGRQDGREQLQAHTSFSEGIGVAGGYDSC